MKFKLFSESPLHIETDCLVIGVTGGEVLPSSVQHIDEASGGEIARLLKSGDIETGTGQDHLASRAQGAAGQQGADRRFREAGET